MVYKMSQNRLNLNFQITGRKERLQYIQDYLSVIPFSPTNEEIETMSNYILWGVDEGGLNGRQEGIEIETKHKTWDSNGRVESLDALIESPGFNEASLRDSVENPPTKIPHQKLSRSLIRQVAPPNSLSTFEELWTQIDETEFLLNQYEILEGKRTEVRPQLLRRLNPSVQATLQARASSLGSYSALKLKHQLVELRREQYALKDSFSPTLLVQPQINFNEDGSTFLGEDVPIFPLGLRGENLRPTLARLVWREDRMPEPNDFTKEDLKEISTFLWKKQNVSHNGRFFDFEDEGHLYELFQFFEEIQDTCLDRKNEQARKFLDTLEMYVKLAELDETLGLILELKKLKRTNQQIAEEISTRLGKKYQPNYISTLYCKKCLVQIAAAAKTHREVLENVFFPENFKKCKDCGRVLLMNKENFVKRHRSNDGFSPRCKKCEKIKRDRSKE